MCNHYIISSHKKNHGTYGMNKDDIEIFEQALAYKDYFSIIKYTYRFRQFAGDWSDKHVKEVFHRKDSVGVLLYDPDLDSVVMIEQCRAGAFAHDISPWLLEVVAGECEAGETKEDVAIRETAEEAGLSIENVVPICDFFVSPGGTSERLALFYAEVDSSKAGGIHGLMSEHEDIKVHVLPRAEAFAGIADGKIISGPAIIALQWLQLKKLQQD